MKTQQNSETLSLRTCYEYIDESVFKLSSVDPLRSARDDRSWPGYVGLEVEMFPTLNADPNTSPSLIPRKDNPVLRALSQLAKDKGWEVTYEDVGQERLPLILKIADGETITFEPGGQVEFSSQPFRCLDLAQTRLLEVQSFLDSALQQEGVSLVQVGVNPWHTVDEIGIQTPKKRYLAMDSYFRGIPSEAGPRMMRQTCSIQVCLDFGQEESLLVKRYLAAQLLAPTAAALFAYSPYREKALGKDTLSYRTSVWRNLDAKRTGFVGLKSLSKALSRESCVQSYLDFALSCPIVFVEQLGYLVPKKPISMKEWMEHGIQGVFPTLENFIAHLSLLFPEVRPRGYMELRSIDCQPRSWQIASGAFYVGLLYDQKNLETVLEILTPTLGHTDEHMLLAKNGLESKVLREQAKRMVELAIGGIGRIEKGFCGDKSDKILTAFYRRFTERGRTPANDLVDLVKGAGRLFPTLNDFVSLENQWKNLSV